MPPKQGRSSRSTRTKSRRAPSPKERVAADVYSELLSEAKEHQLESNRPLKKRRVDAKTPYGGDASQVEADAENVTEDETTAQPNRQVVFDEVQTDSESDIDWEDVDLEDAEQSDAEINDAPAGDLNLTLAPEEPKPKPRRAARRLPASAADKKKRIDIHKVHLCCLLSHVSMRNHWCNSSQVQQILKPLLSARTRSYLNPKSDLSQFQRSRSFADGLEQASDVWKARFHITERGFSRAEWMTTDGDLSQLSLSDDVENCLDITDFTKLAEKGEGSRDVGAQLFCAMLRSVNVDARLVCSLQPLSFASPPGSRPTPQSNNKVTIYHPLSDNEQEHRPERSSPAAPQSFHDEVGTEQSTPQRIKRFGHSTEHNEHRDQGRAPTSAVKKKKRIVESPYPVYWVEAFNEAIQKWHPVDPVVTHTIAKANKLEPPASDSFNDMTYVLAFDDEGYAKDVTRRYTKAYNAKTRQHRVEYLKGGEVWFKKLLKQFRRRRKLDEDQVEDAELAQKEASEPMPRNVQDFKNHPYYALDRHLHRNEIIHPRKEVGKLSVGKTADAVESIFRRRDVKQVKTADKWYREGREINVGETPLKRVPLRSQKLRNASPDPFESNEEEPQDQGMYAEFQTDIYVPPPIARGRIPKNAFGNLDVYVPSMIPPGGVHIQAPEAAKAAKLAGVDYADAVTGFEFKGRQGTAVTRGVVVAKEFREAVEDIVRGIRSQKAREESKKLSMEALRLWKRFYAGLKIRERVMTHHGEAEGDDEDENHDRDYDDIDMQDELDKKEDDEDQLMGEGGFIEAEGDVNADGHGQFARSNHDESLGDTDSHSMSFRKRRANTPELEPSISSPWDLPASLSEQQGTVETASSQLEHIVRSSPDEGGFVLEDPQEPGGFFLSDTEASNNAVSSGPVDKAAEFMVFGNGPHVAEYNVEHYNGNSATEQEIGHSETAIAPTKQDESHLTSDKEALGDKTSPEEHSLALPQETQGQQISHTAKPVASEHYIDEMSPSQRDIVLKSARESGQSDSDSLLSHDPEDDDAEPDWLDSELG